MDIASLTRDASKVAAAFKVTGEQVVALKEIRILIPERYTEKGLAKIGKETHLVGIYAMVVGQHYAVSRINAMMQFNPSVINTIKIRGDNYLELIFDPGSVVLATNRLVVNDNIAYLIFDEFISKGHIPWFIGYDDLARLFETSDKHAGLKLGSRHVVLGMIAASITRAKSDRTMYYRHAIANVKDPSTVPFAHIKLRSISHGTTNTTSRLVGSFWNDGLTSALVNPAEKTEQIEELLRR